MRRLVSHIISWTVFFTIREQFVLASEYRFDDLFAQKLAPLKTYYISAFALILRINQSDVPLSRWLSAPALFVRFDVETSNHVHSAGIQALLRTLVKASEDIASNPANVSIYDGRAARLPSRAAAGIAASLGLEGTIDSNSSTNWWCLHDLSSFRMSILDVYCGKQSMLRGWQNDGFTWTVSGSTNFHIDRAFRNNAPPFTHDLRCIESSSSVTGSGLHPTVQMKWILSVERVEEPHDRKLANFEMLVLQLLPSGAYFDLDELRKRHDFRAVATLWPNSVNISNAQKQISVDVTDVSSGSSTIDIERPEHASSQHALEFALFLEMPLAIQSSFTLELTLPFHVRYPEPVWLDRSLSHDGRTSSDASTNLVNVHPPWLFFRLINNGKFTSQPLSLAELTPEHSPALFVLNFPSGEGWRFGMVVTITALVHVLGLLWVTSEMFYGKKSCSKYD